MTRVSIVLGRVCRSFLGISRHRVANTRLDFIYAFVCHFNIYRMIFLPFFVVSCFAVPSRQLGIEPAVSSVRYAKVTINYKDIVTGLPVEPIESDEAAYGTTGSFNRVEGRLVHVRSKNNSKGCGVFDNPIPTVHWVALIKRGECRFHDKIYKAAKQYNASAVVIYNNEVTHAGSYKPAIQMKHSVDDVVSIFVKKEFGEQMGRIVDAGNVVTITITMSEKSGRPHMPGSISKTSVLFVSISFIVLMIISLAWLVFYYIQRFRYAHAKERLSRRLANAAKKAISRIPQKTVKVGDKELERDYDQCAVCIEVYKSADVIRILPCKHVFHKSCVDPWLMEQRSCPMCKMDILRAFGLQLNGSQESVVHVEAESATVSGIEPEPLSSPGDPPSGITTSASSAGGGGPKLMQFSHPSVQFHSAPDHDPDLGDGLVVQPDLEIELSRTTDDEITAETLDHRAIDEIGDETQSLMGNDTTVR